MRDEQRAIKMRIKEEKKKGEGKGRT